MTCLRALPARAPRTLWGVLVPVWLAAGASLAAAAYPATQNYLGTVRDLMLLSDVEAPFSGSSNALTGLFDANLYGPEQNPVFIPPSKRLPGSLQINGKSGVTAWVDWGQFFNDERWHDIPGINVPSTVNLTFSLSNPATGAYAYDSNSVGGYFPTDQKGFDMELIADANSILRNFGFCTQYYINFRYNGGDTFAFTGDDDLWVFINGKLMNSCDLGNIHSALSCTISLTAANGLAVNSTNELEIFHCERHSTDSNFKVTTTLVPINHPPAVYDVQYFSQQDATGFITLQASDPDLGDPLSFMIISPPTHGTVNVPTLTYFSNAAFAYTPNRYFYGTDSLSYIAFDGKANSTTIGTVYITIQHVIYPPVAISASYNMLQYSNITINLGATVIDTPVTSYRLVQSPTLGNAVLNPVTGVLTYFSIFDGIDTLQFVANNAPASAPVGTNGLNRARRDILNGLAGDSNIATVTFNVTFVYVPPPPIPSPPPGYNMGNGGNGNGSNYDNYGDNGNSSYSNQTIYIFVNYTGPVRRPRPNSTNYLDTTPTPIADSNSTAGSTGPSGPAMNPSQVAGAIVGAVIAFTLLAIAIGIFAYWRFAAGKFEAQWEEQFRSAQMQLNPLYAAAEKEKFNPLYNADGPAKSGSMDLLSSTPNASTALRPADPNISSASMTAGGGMSRAFDSVEFSTTDYRRTTTRMTQQ